MSFRVLARTLLHLGSELISSDVVALYELVKNSFDAGSRKVEIDVFVRMRHGDVERLEAQLANVRSAHSANSVEVLNAFREQVSAALDRAAPGAPELRRSIADAKDWASFADILAEVNYIAVTDTGEGMSLSTLNEAFLTIGTRSRHAAIDASRSDARRRPVLGEKGIGRLSSMRLGRGLRVESTTAGESYWNLLEIDWSELSHESEALIESFEVQARRGRRKDDTETSGTRVVITALNSEWSIEKLNELIKTEFSKLTDPFEARSVFPVTLRFNEQPLGIPRFAQLLLDHAHASVRAQFERGPDKSMRLSGTVRYKERQRTFAIDGPHLASVADCSDAPHVLESLGPFKLDVFWYNRRILTALEGIGDRRAVLQLIRDWGGGVMVFRDGFRVLPYGGPDDDWLDLDRSALASSGYKVNRAQLVGRLSISSRFNSALTDQANREGLRDSPEKRALGRLLRWVLMVQLRHFLDEVDKEVDAREPAAIEDIEERVRTEERRVEENLAELVRRVPAVNQHGALLGDIRLALVQINSLIGDVRDLAASYESGRGQLLNLAGVGLSVEMLAHELNRATEYALLTLADAPEDQASQPMGALVRTLEAQLRTLQKRLRLLDPLSTAARQRKETFDVVSLLRDVLDAHADRFVREDVDCSIVFEPSGRASSLRIKAVKGMIVQVVENLLANSVYWLRQQRLINPTQRSTIRIAVNATARTISVTDSGPGVPIELRERIFEAFYSTKPAGEGKGLGLFISREIARYHGADLYLEERPESAGANLRTFVLTLENMA